MVIHLAHGCYYWVHMTGTSHGVLYIGRWDGGRERWSVCGFDGTFKAGQFEAISKALEHPEPQ